MEYAKEAIGLGLRQQKYSSIHLKNRSTAQFILTMDSQQHKSVSEQIDIFLKSWERSRKNNPNAHAIWGNNARIHTITQNAKDSQLMEAREFSVLEVARFFGVEPHLLFDLKRATYNSIEAQGIEFVTYTIRGIAERWEQELSYKLFTSEEFRTGKYIVRFDLKGLLRSDAKTRSEYYKMLFDMSAIKPSEITENEGMNIDGAADEYFIDSNNYSKVNDLNNGTEG